MPFLVGNYISELLFIRLLKKCVFNAHPDFLPKLSTVTLGLEQPFVWGVIFTGFLHIDREQFI